MNKLCIFVGMTILGWIGWWLGSKIGFVTGFVISMIRILMGFMFSPTDNWWIVGVGFTVNSDGVFTHDKKHKNISIC